MKFGIVQPTGSGTLGTTRRSILESSMTRGCSLRQCSARAQISTISRRPQADCTDDIFYSSHTRKMGGRPAKYRESQPPNKVTCLPTAKHHGFNTHDQIAAISPNMGNKILGSPIFYSPFYYFLLFFRVFCGTDLTPGICWLPCRFWYLLVRSSTRPQPPAGPCSSP